MENNDLKMVYEDTRRLKVLGDNRIWTEIRDMNGKYKAIDLAVVSIEL